MKIKTIENILNFLKEKEGKELPKAWIDSIKKLKLIERLENHPDDIQYRYEGDLNLEESNITKLPNDLYVTGYLDLARCNQLTKLPKKLFVGESFWINDSNITELPDDLYVGESLNLYFSNISEIPYNLYVGWNVFIANTPLDNKYTHEEIIEMITSKGGTLIGKLFR